MISTEVLVPLASLDARDQGRRRTCLAFALCALGHSQSPDDAGLSPEYLYHKAATLIHDWEPDAGLSLDSALAASEQIALEVDCPYQPTDPPYPLPPVPSGLPLYGAQAYELPVDARLLTDQLRQGNAVGLGLLLTDAFFTPTGGRVLDGGTVVPNSEHAVAVVGLGWESNEPFFMVRNSWGDGWGASGNAWISAQYIQLHAFCAFGI